jgi:hypothetical protein
MGYDHIELIPEAPTYGPKDQYTSPFCISYYFQNKMEMERTMPSNIWKKEKADIKGSFFKLSRLYSSF